MAVSEIRQATVKRKTSETDIALFLRIDGSGEAEVDTGIGFFDHMLKSFAKHGLFDLKLKVTGDLIVDCHHTIEDVGIVLGEAIKEAIGDKMSIRRYGDIILPMDETLIMCAIDLSGRPYLGFESTFTADSVGYFDTQMVKEFFYAISYSAGMNLHIRKIAGENDHHIIEGMFKAFAKALDEALILCAIDLSGRPYLVFDGNFTSDRVGYFDTQMVKEFFYAVSYGAGMNLHIRQISGENDHHIIEGMFKAFAKALDEATMKDSRIKSVLSTKGTL